MRVYVDGKVHVRRARCKSCIFRPVDRGRIHGITDERVAEMVEGCGRDGAIPCHQHLYEGRHVEPVCRGFYDLGVNRLLPLAEALGVLEWVGDDAP